MVVRIYQIKNNDCCYLFRDYDYAKDRLDMEDYSCVYQLIKILSNQKLVLSRDDILDILEDLFMEFNTNKPDDFQGHSLSTSDIIQIDDDLYYCDVFGWKKI